MASFSQLKLKVGDTTVAVDRVSDDTDISKYIQWKCDLQGRDDVEDPFVVVDVGRVFQLHTEWEAALPDVHPFYAVKCNEDKLLLKTLAALGTGFDCASKNEIEAVLDLGVCPDRIIYANPCKQISHIKYAAMRGVELMTFDNEWELHKVKKHFPSAKLVLRIRADDPTAICQLGVKYGCSVPVGKELLLLARALNLQVVGVSFHVGSGCQTPHAYQSALELSSEMFQYAASIGYHFTLLDIGGGFPGDKGSSELFNKVTASINRGLATYFGDFSDLKIIAEPGRYFACSTHAIAVNVISKRLHREDSSKKGERDLSYMYYVNDGVYGSFNCILYDHNVPSPDVLKSVPEYAPQHKTSIWGPTCDGLDKICETQMPELDIGDWIYFDNMGAYTISAYSPFNGFAKPASYYYIRETDCDKFESVVSISTGSVSRVVRATTAAPKHTPHRPPKEYLLSSLGSLAPQEPLAVY